VVSPGEVELVELWWKMHVQYTAEAERTHDFTFQDLAVVWQ